MPEEPNSLSTILTRHANELGEHFDAVLILASSIDEKGTEGFCCRRGNGYAVIGMARDFLVKDEAIIKIKTEINIANDEGDDTTPPNREDE